jgi:hypothetical protein
MGGSCQFSLSYDQGQTFKVVHSVIGGCPLKSQYSVQLPSGAPSGEALFAWTWISRLAGQPYPPPLPALKVPSDGREYYMNCAKITVSNGGSGFDGPDLFVANLNSVNDVTTDLGSDVIFPDPGSSVEYGGDGKRAPPVGVVLLPASAADRSVGTFMPSPEPGTTMYSSAGGTAPSVVAHGGFVSVPLDLSLLSGFATIATQRPVVETTMSAAGGVNTTVEAGVTVAAEGGETSCPEMGRKTRGRAGRKGGRKTSAGDDGVVTVTATVTVTVAG